MSVSPEDSTACWSGLGRDLERRPGVQSDAPPWPLGRSRLQPARPFHVSKRLAHPEAGPAGPHPHDHLVPERGPHRRCRATWRSRGSRRPGWGRTGWPAWAGSDAEPSREVAGGVDRRGSRPTTRGRRASRRTLGARQHGHRAATATTSHGHRGVRPRCATGRPGARHRLPHGHQAPQAERDPGHDVDAEGEVDGLGGGHRHQGGRTGQREGDVAPGGHVEGVGRLHPGEQDGQRALHRARCRPEAAVRVTVTMNQTKPPTARRRPGWA